MRSNMMMMKIDRYIGKSVRGLGLSENSVKTRVRKISKRYSQHGNRTRGTEVRARDVTTTPARKVMTLVNFLASYILIGSILPKTLPPIHLSATTRIAQNVFKSRGKSFRVFSRTPKNPVCLFFSSYKYRSCMELGSYVSSLTDTPRTVCLLFRASRIPSRQPPDGLVSACLLPTAVPHNPLNRI